MRRLEIALGLIQQEDVYILQRRDHNPQIGAAGLIGCFGGKIEDESPLQAVMRELAEETTLNATTPEEWTKLGEVNVQSDHMLEPVKVRAIVYCYRLRKDRSVRAKEGVIERVTKQDVSAGVIKLTPATLAVFEQLL